MKKLTKYVVLSAFLFIAAKSIAQPTPNISENDPKKPALASPRDSITATTATGVTISITYGMPGLKGRSIGKELEPHEDSIWRAGANEATTFEVSKDVMIEGKKLPAGKYAFFTVKHGNEWTLIFNKKWQTWGAYSYKENMTSDALQVKVKQGMEKMHNERLKYMIMPNGRVMMLWGDYAVAFDVK